MKNLKKKFAVFFALFATVLGGIFTSCLTPPREDEKLVVSISGDRISSSSNKYLVTITPPVQFADKKDIYIIYTTNGVDPSLVVQNFQILSVPATDYSPEGWQVLKRGNVFNEPFAVSEFTTVKALAYYFEDGKCYKGTLTSVMIEDGKTATSAANEDAKEKEAEIESGNTEEGIVTEEPPTDKDDLVFKFSSSGSTNSIKYFDTANSRIFKYKDTYVYYQMQFSWTGTNSGKWYLYTRSLGGDIIPKSDSSKYIASGVYLGHSFDANSTTDIKDGKLQLFENGSKTKDLEITTGSDSVKQFSMKYGLVVQQ